jgi:hypothetical protein
MLAFSIDTLEFGGLPSSVDVKDGIVAVALRRSEKTRPGAAIGGPVRVGAQPNMLTFTPDGRRVIVANAGEAIHRRRSFGGVQINAEWARRWNLRGGTSTHLPETRPSESHWNPVDSEKAG